MSNSKASFIWVYMTLKAEFMYCFLTIPYNKKHKDDLSNTPLQYLRSTQYLDGGHTGSLWERKTPCWRERVGGRRIIRQQKSQRPNPKKNMVYGTLCRSWLQPHPMSTLESTQPHLSWALGMGNGQPYARFDFIPQSETLDLASSHLSINHSILSGSMHV